MRLVLREYLSMLKESGELDVLIPDLLLAMGFEPINRPQVGVRQYGVDVPAVGVDPDDGRRKLFLITVKQGDINRDVWDTSGKQAVRPSLHEILDIYLRSHVQPEHTSLPKKIILATGGDIKQDVAPDWTSFTDRHTTQESKYGEISFDFWGGDRLAGLIEEYFLDEYLFPESAQKLMRKTIALVDQNEDEPHHFYALIEETLFERDLPGDKSAGAKRKRQQALRLLNLSQNIVFHWCKEGGNLRPALLCSERLVLRTWDWMRKIGVLDCKTTIQEYMRLFWAYRMILHAFVAKTQPYCHVRDGLFWHGLDELEYPLRTFDLIGVYGVEIAVLLMQYQYASGEARVQAEQLIRAVGHTLISLIENNPASSNPRFDGHAIDIALGLLALVGSDNAEYGVEWVERLSNHIIFAYQIGRHFPISTDSFEDLVTLSTGEEVNKQKLSELSTLLPMLAEWHAILNIPSYESFRQAILDCCPKMELQTWYPDTTTDDALYRTNAGRESGTTLSSIQLPETLEKLHSWLLQLRGQMDVSNQLSCIVHGLPVLGLIASRHFRTPVLPIYWQQMLSEQDSTEAHNTA